MFIELTATEAQKPITLNLDLLAAMGTHPKGGTSIVMHNDKLPTQVDESYEDITSWLMFKGYLIRLPEGYKGTPK